MMMFALFWACTWVRAPGPAPLVEAAGPIDVIGHPQDGVITWLDLTIHAGSAYDPIGQEGLAWHTASLLRQGGAGQRTGPEVDALLERLGTDVEVVVDRELVSFRTRCLTEDVDTVASVLADMIVAPQLDAVVLERLRDASAIWLGQQLAEDDERLGMAVFESWLFAGHRYAHPPRGRAGVMDTISVADVQRFVADRYVRPAVVFGVAGSMIGADGAVMADVPGGAAVQQLIARLSAGLATKLSPDVTPRAVDTIAGREALIVDKDTAGVGVHIGHVTTLHRGHPDWPAMLLAMTAFGEHRQSHGRLYQALRRDRGLNYGSYAYIESYRQDGWSREQETGTGRLQNPFVIWLRPIRPENAVFAVKAALRMLTVFHQEGLEEDEFLQMQQYLTGRVALWAATPGRRLGWAVEAAAMGWPDPIETLPSALAALDRETVNAAIARHLDPDNLRMVLVSDNASALSEILRGPDTEDEDLQTPIVYEGTPPAAASEQALEDEAIARDNLMVRQVTVLPTKELFQ